jgi:type IV pilus assembly protein PilN
MIRINLLPAEMETAPSQVNPVIPLSVAVLIPALVLTPVHLGQRATQHRLQTETASLKSELERYQPIIAQVEALESAKVQLSQRKSIIQQLESERLRYPQFLDDFLKLLPGNLWLNNLTTIAKPSDNTMEINMDVVALDNYAVADLVANFETSQLFSDVDLGAITISNTPLGQTMTFHMTTNYRKAGSTPNANQKS